MGWLVAGSTPYASRGAASIVAAVQRIVPTGAARRKIGPRAPAADVLVDPRGAVTRPPCAERLLAGPDARSAPQKPSIPGGASGVSLERVYSSTVTVPPTLRPRIVPETGG